MERDGFVPLGNAGKDIDLRRRLTLLVAILLFGALTIEVADPAMMQLMIDDGGPNIPIGLTFSQGTPIPPVRANKVPDITKLRPASAAAIRVALISSGVDTSVLPAPFKDQVSWQNYNADQFGYGTYAASVIFQLHASAQITSLPVYSNGVLSLGYLDWAFRMVVQWPESYDVVVVAIPPSEFVDPITAAMASGLWDDVEEAIALSPFKTSMGHVFGVPRAPQSDDLFSQQPLSPYNRALLSSFRISAGHWDNVQGALKQIVTSNIPVVVPAGDLGPNPQTVFGIANFPEVITVGGFHAPTSTAQSGTISPSSSAGPSIDLRIKPDLLAATGVIGVLPQDSELASYLRSNNMIDNSLAPDWSPTGPSLSTPDKTLLDSNLVSAAIVGTTLGGIRAQGRTATVPVDLDVAHLRGALYGKTSHLPGLPVWKQGHGALGGANQDISVPDLAFATSSPLILSHADLGLEPSDPPWSVTVPVAQQLTASIEGVEVKDFIGVDFDATAKIATVAASAAPEVTATYSPISGIMVAATTGEWEKEAGFYAGVIEVALTGTGGSVTQHLPFDLVKGLKPLARSFAIHDASADPETFSLSPGLPPGADALEHPLSMLPINPLDQAFFFKVTDLAACYRYPDSVGDGLVSDLCNGHGAFEVVPPGYYTVREWSDYGAPYQYTLSVSNTATAGTWASQTLTDDLGGKVAYTSYKTLLLPMALDTDAPQGEPKTCVETYGPYDDWSGHNGSETSFAGITDPNTGEPYPELWQDCTKNFLDAKGLNLAEYDPPTGGFFITQTAGSNNPDPLRINLGFLRKAIQTQVSSRYIDIVHPCTDIRFLSFRTAYVTTFYNLMHPTDTVQADWQSGCDNFETLLATLNTPDDQSTGAIGLARAHYAFNLPTPNYTAHMSLNFSYEVKNAFILVAVQIGGEVAVGLVTPYGTVQLPGGSPGDPIDLGELQVHADGFATGTANFEFEFAPKGAVKQGDMYLWFTPWQYWNTFGIQSAASWAKLVDNPATNDTFSFEMRTWSPVGWPPINYRHREDEIQKSCKSYNLPGQDCGHNFQLNSRYNHRLTDPLSGSYVGGDTQIAEPPECREITGDGEKAQVCEDWAMMVHSPRPPLDDRFPGATLMDAVEVTNPDSTTTVFTSVAQDLKDSGAKLYTPPQRINDGYFLLTFSGGLTDAQLTSTIVGSKFHTASHFFELLPLPLSFIKQHSRDLEVCINDYGPRWATGSTTHYSSLCAGTNAGGSFTVSNTSVPCLEKVPAKPGQPCESLDLGHASTTPSATPELRPYVRYPNRFTHTM